MTLHHKSSWYFENDRLSSGFVIWRFFEEVPGSSEKQKCAAVCLSSKSPLQLVNRRTDVAVFSFQQSTNFPKYCICSCERTVKVCCGPKTRQGLSSVYTLQNMKSAENTASVTASKVAVDDVCKRAGKLTLAVASDFLKGSPLQLFALFCTSFRLLSLS